MCNFLLTLNNDTGRFTRLRLIREFMRSATSERFEAICDVHVEYVQVPIWHHEPFCCKNV